MSSTITTKPNVAHRRLRRLQRRLDWLTARILVDKGSVNQKQHDLAEASALRWAIAELCELHKIDSRNLFESKGE